MFSYFVINTNVNSLLHWRNSKFPYVLQVVKRLEIAISICNNTDKGYSNISTPFKEIQNLQDQKICKLKLK